jgi:hypothetical protein
MKGQQQLSPKKYIETKARTLPIYKCWVNPDWEEAGIVNVIVARSHSNGHLTAGFYLVDLMCLGVKDTMYFFNETKERIEEVLRFDQGNLAEVDYKLAHNIVYAGYDFAAEFEIHPHKDFAITKYILEEDTEAIPVVEIPVGDEEGRPSLNVSSDYNYQPVLEKLRKNAGEGNYTFLISDFDEDDLDFEEEDDIDEDWLDNIEKDYIDFNDVRVATDDELEAVYNSGDRSLSDERIIHVEQMLRLLNEREPGWIKTDDEIMDTKEYRLSESAAELYEATRVKSENLIEKLFTEIDSLPSGAELEAGEHAAWFELFIKHAKEETAAFIVLISMSLFTTASNLKYLRKHLKEYPPLVQLTIAGFIMAMQEELFESHFDFITKARVVDDAFPGYKPLHFLHHKIFWVVKALYAMNHDNTEQLQHYHALLSLTGIGGKLKSVYATRFAEWLEKHS